MTSLKCGMVLGDMLFENWAFFSISSPFDVKSTDAFWSFLNLWTSEGIGTFSLAVQIVVTLYGVY